MRILKGVEIFLCINKRKARKAWSMIDLKNKKEKEYVGCNYWRYRRFKI